MLANNAEFSGIDLMTIFGTDRVINIDENFECKTVSIDSRKIEPGNIFVALHGETLDGHTKIGDAFAKGASVCLVDDAWFAANKADYPDKSFIVCADSLHGLGKLGQYNRLRYDYPVLCVAGSNGKTTTKDMIAHVLSAKFNLLKTFENFNNQLGTPLMLLQMNDEYNMAVLEIGTNEPGEIVVLSEMVCPTHGVITNIGKEHLEKLIDLDGVEQEETFLYAFLLKHGGMSLVNMDDERLAKYTKILNKLIGYGQNPDARVHAEIKLSNDIKPSLALNYDNESIEINLQTDGLASAINAIAAVAAGVAFDMTLEEIKVALESFVSESSHSYARMTLQKINNIKVLNDCYNANPSSMRMAITTLQLIKTDLPKIAVLGDMREMGEAAIAEHIDILKYALENADKVILLGDSFSQAAAAVGCEAVTVASNHEEIASLLSAQSGEFYMLLKGSRGMKMERVIEESK